MRIIIRVALLHQSSVSGTKARFCARYAGLMQQGDPYYNPHFTLLYENYGYK